MLSSGKNFAGFRHLFKSKYLRRTSYLKVKYNYIVDKMPENFLYIGYLLKLLPKAKIIRIYRNPWILLFHYTRQRYVQNVPYSCSFFNIGIFWQIMKLSIYFGIKKSRINQILWISNMKILFQIIKFTNKRYTNFLKYILNMTKKKKRGFFFLPNGKHKTSSRQSSSKIN